MRAAFEHSWTGYKKHAWLRDELKPLSGEWRTTYGGWAATLVDSLDSLYIMGFDKEFDEAVDAVEEIDFNAPPVAILNVFETTIRYLGGLLSAYDLSGHDVLLEKALELGELLYAAFDTPNHLPIARWNWTQVVTGGEQQAQYPTIIAETASLSLELTRLSQLSGDAKYYDAAARITELLRSQQLETKLPGMWPLVFNGTNADTRIGDTFGLGAMADSLYEYLPKEYLLLGGRVEAYRSMYETAMNTAKHALFFRPMHPENAVTIMAGLVHIGPENSMRHEPEGQHLTCFAGGMLALAARGLRMERHLSAARQMTNAGGLHGDSV